MDCFQQNVKRIENSKKLLSKLGQRRIKLAPCCTRQTKKDWCIFTCTDHDKLKPEAIVSFSVVRILLGLGQIEINNERARLTQAGRVALKRMATPDEIARTAVFLLSQDAGFVTGTAMFADGGVSVTR